MSKTITLQYYGEEITAMAIEIQNRHHHMFKVVFDNGYENIFFTDVETGQWLEEDLGFTALAKEVGKQVKLYSGNLFHVPRMLTWHRQLINDEPICFGFFNYMKDKYKMYEIYHVNKKYLYTLVEMDNDEWQILGNNMQVLGNIDRYFVEQVIQILPLYWANSR
jgi:hypothetical protein